MFVARTWCCLFFDASQRISKVDKQLAGYIAEQYKPCVFVVNKWDLYRNQMATERWVKYLRDTFRTMWHVPVAFVTAQTGKNVKALLNHAQMLYKQSRVSRDHRTTQSAHSRCHERITRRRCTITVDPRFTTRPRLAASHPRSC